MALALPDKTIAGVRLRLHRLVSFLSGERRLRSISDQERQDLELGLIAIIVAVMVLLQAVPQQAGVYLNLYFLPVTVSAFYLGRHRSGLAATLCILATIFVIASDSLSISFFVVTSWAAVLILSALCIGTLSDELNCRFEEVYENHVSETRTDALTNVANRRSFDHELERQLEVWIEAGTPFCLVLADIDEFKRFNDTYGHQAGDKVLHDVARSLEATVRSTDIVARYGGEEFAIIMPATTINEAVEIAEQVRLDVEATRYFYQRVKLRITFSGGVSQVQSDDDAQLIIRRADDALYAAKQSGRNCVFLHTGTECECFGAAASYPSQDSGENGLATPHNLLFVDQLTNLPTRQVFMSELTRRIRESERYGCQFTVAVIRVAALSELERYGAASINRALTIIGDLIQGVMRETDFVVRYNSDCFAMMMPFTTPAQATGAIHRLLDEIEKCESIRHQGQVMELRATYGMVQPAGEGSIALMNCALAHAGLKPPSGAPPALASVNAVSEATLADR